MSRVFHLVEQSEESEEMRREWKESTESEAKRVNDKEKRIKIVADDDDSISKFY